MKTTLLLLFFILKCISSFSQIQIRGTVRDAKDKSPLAFCAITVKGNGKSYVANEDGGFQAEVISEGDTLVFSYIGYVQKQIPVRQLLQSPDVFLVAANVDLAEVVIHGNDDYLFEIMDRCRKKIHESPAHHSKVYFLMQTDMNGSPVEMMECYYNGYVNGNAVQKLALKNGRIGLAESQDHGFFLSENTAHALALLNMIEKNDDLPGLPLQFNASKQKRIFSIHLDPEFSDAGSFHIAFVPRTADGKFFSGDVWVDKKTFALLKINLRVENAAIHPFVPVWHEDALSNVSLFFSESFTREGNEMVPENISFRYHLYYHNNKAYRSEKMNSHVTAITDTAEQIQEISTSGSLNFYDFENGFTLPHYKYDDEATDYRKILSLPFNESFWAGDPRMLYTDKQKRALSFFNENGVLINYRKNSAMKRVSQAAGNFFEGVNIFWSDTGRLSFHKNNLDADLKKDSLSQSKTFRIDQYHLQAQIFLDENLSGDSVLHFSATVFDLNNSYYNLPAEPFTDCFLNIYFDIVETERRKMESTLNASALTIQQIDSVYTQTMTNVSLQSAAFIKDSESGQNMNGLLKWNNYILDNLGIDNMKIFGLK